MDSVRWIRARSRRLVLLEAGRRARARVSVCV
jgi:hypothetical protein